MVCGFTGRNMGERETVGQLDGRTVQRTNPGGTRFGSGPGVVADPMNWIQIRPISFPGPGEPMRTRASWCAAGCRWVLLAGVLLAPLREVRAQQTTPPIQVVPGRLLGVFDAETGEPLAGARVLNVSNGLSVETTVSGTVSLFFVDTVGGLLRITKLGYDPEMLLVANSTRDTVPLTVVLSRQGQLLQTVVSRGRRPLTPRGPADTVRRLDDVGFYDRRYTTGAPSASFITAKQLNGMRTLDDLPRISGRPICTGNIYLDGVRVTVPSRYWGNGRISLSTTSPLDMIVPIGEIAGVEMYNGADAPEEFNATEAHGATLGCVTLIWTK